jgi:hypothetical protein
MTDSGLYHRDWIPGSTVRHSIHHHAQTLSGAHSGVLYCGRTLKRKIPRRLVMELQSSLLAPVTGRGVLVGALASGRATHARQVRTYSLGLCYLLLRNHGGEHAVLYRQ